MWTRRSQAEKKRHDAYERELQETDSLLVQQQPRVNAVVAWLEARKLQNGFGDDFEWTLAHPRTK